MNEPLLKAQGLVKRFRTPSGGETIAIDYVDIDLYKGEVIALIGESGSGKTTLGRALLRLLALDAGEITFDGVDLLSLRGSQLREARRSFQMVFQNQQANLHPRLSVIEMLNESLRLHQPLLDEESRIQKATDLLDRVGLTDHHQRYLASLSGGEQRRVGLARILATTPKLVVADEPTSGLDAAIKLQTIDLLKELRGDSLTYLLISHDLGLVRRIADRVLVMLRGRIIEEVPIEGLGKVKHHPYTQKLLDAANLGSSRGQAAEVMSTTTASIEDVQGRGPGCHYCELCPLLTNDESLSIHCTSHRPPLENKVACFPLSVQRGNTL